jgi:hypothetical protein
LGVPVVGGPDFRCFLKLFLTQVFGDFTTDMGWYSGCGYLSGHLREVEAIALGRFSTVTALDTPFFPCPGRSALFRVFLRWLRNFLDLS